MSSISQAYKSLENSQEQFGASMKFESKNMRYSKTEASEFFNSIKNDTLAARKLEEQNYYTHLITGLFHQIAEQRWITNDFDFLKTRRIVYTNPDCMSFIQVLIREDDIHVIVQFRSSDYLNCLPTDLEFISSIPMALYRFIENNIDDDVAWPDVDTKFLQAYSIKKCNFTVSFGSLH